MHVSVCSGHLQCIQPVHLEPLHGGSLNRPGAAATAPALMRLLPSPNCTGWLSSPHTHAQHVTFACTITTHASLQFVKDSIPPGSRRRSAAARRMQCIPAGCTLAAQRVPALQAADKPACLADATASGALPLAGAQAAAQLRHTFSQPDGLGHMCRREGSSRSTCCPSCCRSFYHRLLV